MKDINIGILGCGIVGTGVAKLLMESHALLKSRIGVGLNLKYVADLDTHTPRGITFKEGVFISDASRVLNDPDIDIVVELIGGKTIAQTFTLQALENKKHVVTANKALIASHGNELVKIATANQVEYAFEASCGGCMPVVKSIRESLVGNHIQSFTGILNGTCNYILTKISKEGCLFEDGLKEAQAKGYAEADPFLDVEGHDSAHKLAILAALAYGMEINLADIHVEGISQITPMDIEFAKDFGYCIKLLAISKNEGDTVEARVHPAMIPLDSPLAHVDKAMNAITIDGDASGQTMLYGAGAGMMPTASAVISDIVDIARNIISGCRQRVPIMSYPGGNIKKIAIKPVSEIKTGYYIRLAALDQPGVLSRVSGILADHGISIKSVHQKGRRSNGTVPIVMTTHIAREKDVQDALAKISNLDSIPENSIIIRIEDKHNDQ